jgi:hypothetical protein
MSSGRRAYFVRRSDELDKMSVARQGATVSAGRTVSP